MKERIIKKAAKLTAGLLVMLTFVSSFAWFSDAMWLRELAYDTIGSIVYTSEAKWDDGDEFYYIEGQTAYYSPVAEIPHRRIMKRICNEDGSLPYLFYRIEDDGTETLLPGKPDSSGKYKVVIDTDTYNNSSEIDQVVVKNREKVYELIHADRVEYIEATGSQYANTGVVATSNDTSKISFMYTGIDADGDALIFGNPFYNIGVAGIIDPTDKNSGNWQYRNGDLLTFQSHFTPFAESHKDDVDSDYLGNPINKIVFAEVDKDKVMFTDAFGNTREVTAQVMKDGLQREMFLFARSNRRGQADTFSQARIYSFIIERGDGSRETFYPAITDDGRIGFFHLEKGRMCFNEGTGEDFIAGKVIEGGIDTEVMAVQWDNIGEYCVDLDFVPTATLMNIGWGEFTLNWENVYYDNAAPDTAINEIPRTPNTNYTVEINNEALPNGQHIIFDKTEYWAYDGYRVEYLQSTSEQGIDTNYAPKNSTMLSILAMSWDNGNVYNQDLYGANDLFNFKLRNYNNQATSYRQGFAYTWKEGKTDYREDNGDFGTMWQQVYYQEASKDGLFIVKENGKIHTMPSKGSQEEDFDRAIRLGVFHNGNRDKNYPVYPSTSRIYELRIYEDGMLKHDYVPSVRQDTGAAGFIDKMNGLWLGDVVLNNSSADAVPFIVGEALEWNDPELGYVAWAQNEGNLYYNNSAYRNTPKVVYILGNTQEEQLLGGQEYVFNYYKVNSDGTETYIGHDAPYTTGDYRMEIDEAAMPDVANGVIRLINNSVNFTVQEVDGIEYIEATGQQKIITSILLTEDTKMEVVAKAIDENTETGIVFGSGNNYMTLYNSAGQFVAQLLYRSGMNNYYSTSPLLYTHFADGMPYERAYRYAIKGYEYSVENTSGQKAEGERNSVDFIYANSDAGLLPSAARIYDVIITNPNQTLHLVPAVDAYGVAGMWNYEDGTFYYSEVEGVPYIPGPEKGLLSKEITWYGQDSYPEGIANHPVASVESFELYDKIGPWQYNFYKIHEDGSKTLLDGAPSTVGTYEIVAINDNTLTNTVKRYNIIGYNDSYEFYTSFTFARAISNNNVGSYIDTGYFHKANSSYETAVSDVYTSGRESHSINSFISSRTWGELGYFIGDVEMPLDSDVGKYHQIRAQEGSAYLTDGQKEYNIEGVSLSKMNTVTVGSSGEGRSEASTVYYFNIYEGGELRHTYQPAFNKITGQKGMYDRITGKFAPLIQRTNELTFSSTVVNYDNYIISDWQLKEHQTIIDGVELVYPKATFVASVNKSLIPENIEYEYYSIDADGNETLLDAAPTTAGHYKSVVKGLDGINVIGSNYADFYIHEQSEGYFKFKIEVSKSAVDGTASDVVYPNVADLDVYVDGAKAVTIFGSNVATSTELIAPDYYSVKNYTENNVGTVSPSSFIIYGSTDGENWVPLTIYEDYVDTEWTSGTEKIFADIMVSWDDAAKIYFEDNFIPVKATVFVASGIEAIVEPTYLFYSIDRAGNETYIGTEQPTKNGSYKAKVDLTGYEGRTVYNNDFVFSVGSQGLYKYYKINITGANRNGSAVKYTSMAELSLYDVEGNNVANTKYLNSNASSTLEGSTKNAFDENSGTIWHSTTNGLPQWLEVELTEPTAITYYGITIRNNYADNPTDWVLYGSYDGNNYEVIHEVIGGEANWGVGATKKFYFSDIVVWSAQTEFIVNTSLPVATYLGPNADENNAAATYTYYSIDENGVETLLDKAPTEIGKYKVVVTPEIENNSFEFIIRDYYDVRQSGYTPLEYVEGTGAQYIDTGYIPNINTQIHMVSQTDSIKGKYPTLFGNTNTNFYTRIYQNGNTYALGLNNTSKTLNWANSGITNPVGQIITIDTDGYQVIFSDQDGNTATINSGESSLTYQNSSILILALHSGNTTNIVDYSASKIFEFVISESGNAVHYFVPAMDADGKVGLFDRITGDFLTSATATALVAGPERCDYYVQWTGDVRVEESSIVYPVATAEGYEGEITYEYYLIDEEGNETLLDAAPTVAGKYIIKAILDVTADKKIKDDTIEFEIFKYNVQKYQYFKFYVDSSTRDKCVSIREFALYDTEGNNVALSMAESFAESGHYGNLSVANAFDGNPDTLWHTPTDGFPEYIQIKLTEEVNIVEYGLTVGNSTRYPDYPLSWKIYGSLDGEEWTVLDEHTVESSYWTLGVEKIHSFTQRELGNNDYIDDNGGEYVAVEYVTSNGGYIDTGFIPNQDTRVTMQISSIAASGYMFGMWNNNSRNPIFVVANDGEYSGKIWSGYGSENGVDGAILTDAAHEVTLDKNLLYIDGALYKTFNTATFTANHSIYLMAQNRAGAAYIPKSNNSISVAGCQVYDNGTMVRNFVPVVSPDGIAGMFDTVNNKFYGSANSNGFIAGPEATAAVLSLRTDVQETEEVVEESCNCTEIECVCEAECACECEYCHTAEEVADNEAVAPELTEDELVEEETTVEEENVEENVEEAAADEVMKDEIVDETIVEETDKAPVEPVEPETPETVEPEVPEEDETLQETTEESVQEELQKEEIPEDVPEEQPVIQEDDTDEIIDSVPAKEEVENEEYSQEDPVIEPSTEVVIVENVSIEESSEMAEAEIDASVEETTELPTEISD